MPITARPGTLKMILKWLGFAIELYSLFVFINTALLAPTSWNLERILFVTGSGIVSSVCAYYSGLGFKPLVGHKHSMRSMLFTIPWVLWWGTVIPSVVLILVSWPLGMRS